MSIEFNGGSWGLGVLCAGVYLGAASPWLLLLVPVLILVPMGTWRMPQ